jgi:acetolactate synthase I/II/III large subunit
MPSRPQERFLSILEFGAIGNGSSFAMGVAAARPDSPVVLFDGLGGHPKPAIDGQLKTGHRT